MRTRSKNAKDAITDRVYLYYQATSVSGQNVKPLRKQFPISSPIVNTSSANSERCILECTPLEVDPRGNIIDESGRKILLKGINLDASMKLPSEPNMPSYKGNPQNPGDIWYDGDHVSFVGRPFPLSDAKEHLARIKSWGYNTIRYLLTWEAIEHKGPGIYDDEFVDYTIEILKVIHELGGLYVFLEFHQDVWSRYSGGSGAPMWTLYAAGLDPKKFGPTEAAILHNEPRFHDESPERYHKMLWTSNYKRLAAFTMFTLLFAGKNYFPDLIINGENIQDYLQSHLLNAHAYIWKAVVKKLPHMVKDGTILGFELMNEPNCGLIGHEDLSIIPFSQQLRVGTTPTAYQALRLGMGLACEVDVYRIAITGPQRYDNKVVDPKGVRAWLSPEDAIAVDKKYGWKRGPNWKLGECIYAQRGVWKWDSDVDWEALPTLTTDERKNIANAKCALLKPYFFSVPDKDYILSTDKVPKAIDINYFINHNFVDFFIKFKKTVRDIEPNAFVFLQPPVLELPPNVKDDPRKVVDRRTVYCPHYYDGMSLMFKSWNTKYNVDTLGIMRGRYLNPVLGIVFGERAIRNCIRKQFIEMRAECEDNLGLIPILMSETGMPFDMDKKKSYENQKYVSQTAALDALSYALEGLNMHHTYWCYASINCHEWGDRWNNEDFSFWSPEDRNIVEERLSRFENSSQSSSRSISLNRIKSKVQSIRRRSNSRRNSLANIMFDGYRRGSTSSASGQPVSADERRGSVASLKTLVPGSPRFNSRDERRGSVMSVSELANNTTKLVLNEGRNGNITLHQSTLASTKDSPDKTSESITPTECPLITAYYGNVAKKHTKRCYPSPDGVRAAGAVIRPYLIATKGVVNSSEFDLKTCKFALSSKVDLQDESLNRTPTIIFVPKWHYPYLDYGDIFVSSGYVKYNRKFEYLEWYHKEMVGKKSPLRKQIVEESDSSSVNEPSLLTEATIIIKNNSGGIDEVDDDDQGSATGIFLPKELCPIT